MHKLLPKLLLLGFFTGVHLSFGQGALVYDQTIPSLGGSSPLPGGWIIQSNSITQSFTPAFSNIDFVQLAFSDKNPSNNLGATISVSLYEGSLSGAFLGSTAAVSVTNGFGVAGGMESVLTFYFPSSASLVPGTTYLFQPVVQTGDAIGISAYNWNYSGGTLSVNGETGGDMWFTEGIVVPAPEPGTLALGAVGLGVLGWGMCRRCLK